MSETAGRDASGCFAFAAAQLEVDQGRPCDEMPKVQLGDSFY